MKQFLLFLIAFHSVSNHLQTIEENLKLQITEPESLAKLFMHNKMEYTVANMGNIPFDTNLNGHLQLASPVDGCTVYSNTQRSPIYMVQRGNCSFIQKQQYAQMAGAKLLVIADNIFENESELLLSSDNFTASYDVPLIMISKYDANLILPYLQSGRESDTVNINVQFPKMNHEATSKIDLWISSNDYLSLEIAEELQSTYEYDFVFDTQVTMKIHYMYYFCMSCHRTGYMTAFKDCLCGGRYCFSITDNDDLVDQSIKGEDIVAENLKQSCIYKQSPVEYIRYIQKFRQNCFKDKKLIVEFSKCGDEQDIYMTVDTIEKTKSCIKSSYTNPDDIKGRGDNTMMGQDRSLIKQYDISSFPLALINGQEYKGTFHGAHMIRTICQSFRVDNLPAHCKDYIFTKDHYSHLLNLSVSNFPYFKFSILLLVLLGIYLYFYRRSLKKEMKKEMDLQVSSAISQYHALGETQQRL